MRHKKKYGKKSKGYSKKGKNKGRRLSKTYTMRRGGTKF